MGKCHTWDRCTSPTPCKTTSSGGDEERMPQEKHGKVVTQWPTSKASLGWKNRKLQLELWTSTRASTKDGWGPHLKRFGCRPLEEHACKAKGWHLYPLMLADSEPKEECYHSLNWVMAGKANKMKWGEWNGQAAHMLGWRAKRSTTLMQNAPTYREVPTPILEGMVYTLQSSQAEMREHEVMLFKGKGGVYIQTPKKYPTFDYLHR